MDVMQVAIRESKYFAAGVAFFAALGGLAYLVTHHPLVVFTPLVLFLCWLCGRSFS